MLSDELRLAMRSVRYEVAGGTCTPDLWLTFCDRCDDIVERLEAWERSTGRTPRTACTPPTCPRAWCRCARSRRREHPCAPPALTADLERKRDVLRNQLGPDLGDRTFREWLERALAAVTPEPGRRPWLRRQTTVKRPLRKPISRLRRLRPRPAPNCQIMPPPPLYATNPRK